MISSSLRPPAGASAMTLTCWQVKPSPIPGRNMLISHCECEEGPGPGSPLNANTFCHVAVYSAVVFHLDFANAYQ